MDTILGKTAFKLILIGINLAKVKDIQQFPSKISKLISVELFDVCFLSPVKNLTKSFSIIPIF